jgi:hypothetical protein
MMPCDGDSKMTGRRDREAEIDTELAELTREYSEWNKAQGLKLGSADEHLFDETLTEKQRAWLRDFSQRWEGASPMLTGGLVVRHRDL